MSSNDRITIILFKLFNNHSVSLIDLSEEFGVSLRTVQRDISTINNISHTFNGELIYNSLRKSYSLFFSSYKLESDETLAIIKILFASRAFSEREMTNLISKLILLSPDDNIDTIKKAILNELTFYSSLNHQQDLLKKIQNLSKLITKGNLVAIDYNKNNGETIYRTVLPVSIFFSEYYFYVICYEPEKDRYINLRMDRFKQINKTNKHFDIPHSNRLEEKELREKMLFMYSGTKKTFTFKYSGIVEAALDKFPNSKVIKTYDDSSVLIEATAYDTGTIMWLLSQGSRVKVLSPPSLIKDIKTEILRMNNIYK